MITPDLFFNKTQTLESELSFAAIDASPEFAVLLKRAAKEVQRQRVKIAQYEYKAYLDSWDKNPDRMGGSFTEQEKQDANAWR